MPPPVTPKGVRLGGRAKGTQNKITQDAKAAIEMVAQGLGGAQGMLAWVKESSDNARIFWGTIYPKLLPFQITGANGEALKIVIEKPATAGTADVPAPPLLDITPDKPVTGYDA